MFFKKPSNHREWSADQALLPYADFLDRGNVLVHHVRNIHYRTQNDYDVNYYDGVYDANAIDSVWFLLSRLSLPGVAHTLLSFRFRDGQTLALSVEVRKKSGEKFSLLRMLPRQYELMYVLADERDVVRLRLSILKERTYFFPLRIQSTQASKILRDALLRANQMRERPEFYHPTFNNSTNNLMRHVRSGGIILPRAHWRYVFPATLTSLFESYGLLPLGETCPTIEEKYFISPLSEHCEDNEHFARCIRGELSSDFEPTGAIAGN